MVVAPALAAGNTVVLKPAEYTSLTALKFAEICRDVGLPAGVVNIVTGDGQVGELLVGLEVEPAEERPSPEGPRRHADRRPIERRRFVAESSSLETQPPEERRRKITRFE